MNNILKVFGQLALVLKLGGSRKDALSNAGSIFLVVSVVIEGLIQSKIIPDQYQPLVINLLGAGGAIVGLVTGQKPNLSEAENGKQ
jgi:hypothetical protein